MLNGFRFWTDDKIWRGIFIDLGAVPAARDIADIEKKRTRGTILKTNLLELKASAIAGADMRVARIIKNACGYDCDLSDAQKKIVLALAHADLGLSVGDLRAALGYAMNADTHAPDTIIYQLRKKFGGDFIKFDNGMYKLGDTEKNGEL